MSAPAQMESASQCDRCGEIVADIDAGFSPGLHEYGHECGGTWRRIMWDRQTGVNGRIDAAAVTNHPNRNWRAGRPG